MAQEPLKPAYAIWGEDRATIDRAVSRLIARVERDGGMPPERVKAEETPAGDVVAACEALSFGGLRLVLVEGADAWKAADAAPVVRYLEAPNAGVVPGDGVGGAADARSARRGGRARRRAALRPRPQGQARRAGQVARRPLPRGGGPRRGLGVAGAGTHGGGAGDGQQRRRPQGRADGDGPRPRGREARRLRRRRAGDGGDDRRDRARRTPTRRSTSWPTRSRAATGRWSTTCCRTSPPATTRCRRS